MALHQAQDLAAAKYKLVSRIRLSERAFIVDMTYGGNRNIGISVTGLAGPEVDTDGFMYLPENTRSKISTNILSDNGYYLGFQLKTNAVESFDRTENGVIFVTETSVYINDGKCGKYPEDIFNTERCLVYGPGVEFETTEESVEELQYYPQGVFACRSGAILICLWNNKAGEQSLGKVVAAYTYKKFEIFMDKNRPLLICPTYITENANGDICVSDVGAVVVTDAGGMLRFRYQTDSPNFESYGLCCDSACNIIIADMKNDRIHVIDKDGGFLNYVMYEGIKMPRALCIDEEDNVYVGEWNADSIKVLSCKKL